MVKREGGDMAVEVQAVRVELSTGWVGVRASDGKEREG